MTYTPKTDNEIRDAIRRKDYDAVIRATWPLATKTARKYAGPGYELDDAVQDALLEIHRAALAFDLNGDVPFLALALKYMHNQLASRKYEAARTMPINRATGWLCNRVTHLVDRGMTIEDACNDVGIMQATYMASLNTAQLVPIDGISIPSSDDATSAAMSWACRQSIKQATQSMTVMEQRAIRDKMQGRCLTHTAREIGVSNQRAHQAYQSAVKKMRTIGKKYLEAWVMA